MTINGWRFIMKRILLILVSTLLLASCTPQASEARMKDTSGIANTTWEVVSFEDESGNLVRGMGATAYYNGMFLVFEPDSTLIIADSTQAFDSTWSYTDDGNITVTHPSGGVYEGYFEDDSLVLGWNENTLHLALVN